MLCWSNWETGTVCFSESYESLSQGLQNALWTLGGVPQRHRTDNLTSAVNRIGNPETFTAHYRGLANHYGFASGKIQPRSPEENGDVEQRHYRLKKAADQALMLRGSRDFVSRQEYEQFLEQMFEQLDAGRQERLREELKALGRLPARRHEDFREIECRVGVFGTIRVLKNTYSLHSRLAGERVKAGVVRSGDIPPISQSLACRRRHGNVFCLWRGDITRIGTDAIVNAANNALLGCLAPLHSCIDNCIHSAAGPRLRADCAKIMALQREPEAPGQAKITRAYNLPARFILHTVGPIIHDKPTDQGRETLAVCYAACLDLAAEVGGIETIAFCSISTGVYRFPGDEAASIAVDTVTQWLDQNQGPFRKILFDVYSQGDHEHYRRLLSH